MNSHLLLDPAHRRRLLAFQRRPLPEPKVYSPRLRRDQIKAVYFLKRFEGRPMTKLLQEALDRYLEPHGGVEALIERGVAQFGERGDVRCQRLPPTTRLTRGGLPAPLRATVVVAFASRKFDRRTPA